MGVVQEALQIAFCVVVALATVVAAIVVWRDDHSKRVDGGWV